MASVEEVEKYLIVAPLQVGVEKEEIQIYILGDKRQNLISFLSFSIHNKHVAFPSSLELRPPMRDLLVDLIS